MVIIKQTTLYIMSLLYVIIGIKHFEDPELFITLVPPMIEFKKEAVYLSGLFEIIFGAFLVFKKTRKIGALGIICLLIMVFPANIYLYVSDIPRDVLNVSKQQAFIRMPFQIPLIIISYWHSKEIHSKIFSIICVCLFVPTILYFLTL